MVRVRNAGDARPASGGWVGGWVGDGDFNAGQMG